MRTLVATASILIISSSILIFGCKSKEQPQAHSFETLQGFPTIDTGTSDTIEQIVALFPISGYAEEKALHRSSLIARNYLDMTWSDMQDELLRHHIQGVSRGEKDGADVFEYIVTTTNDDLAIGGFSTIILQLTRDRNMSSDRREPGVSGARVLVRTLFDKRLEHIAIRSSEIATKCLLCTALKRATQLHIEQRFPVLDWSEIWYDEIGSLSGDRRLHGYRVDVQCSGPSGFSGSGWRGAFAVSGSCSTQVVGWDDCRNNCVDRDCREAVLWGSVERRGNNDMK